jgi:hypothetical protein
VLLLLLFLKTNEEERGYQQAFESQVGRNKS